RFASTRSRPLRGQFTRSRPEAGSGANPAGSPHTEPNAAGRPVLELWGDWPGKLPPDHPARVLCQHCEDAAAARAKTQLSAGQARRGQGWELPAAALTARGKTIDLGELTAAELHDGRLCLWVRGADDPVLKLPWVGPNAPVLLALLRERT